jgi:hypothetical protein
VPSYFSGHIYEQDENLKYNMAAIGKESRWFNSEAIVVA